MLTKESVVVAIQEQVFSKLADEIVLLSLNEGIYYGLNPVGADIWELIQAPMSVEAIRDQIVVKYDVDAERCEREILALLHELQQHGLVHVNEPVEHTAEERS